MVRYHTVYQGQQWLQMSLLYMPCSRHWALWDAGKSGPGKAVMCVLNLKGERTLTAGTERIWVWDAAQPGLQQLCSQLAGSAEVSVSGELGCVRADSEEPTCHVSSEAFMLVCLAIFLFLPQFDQGLRLPFGAGRMGLILSHLQSWVSSELDSSESSPFLCAMLQWGAGMKWM